MCGWWWQSVVAVWFGAFALTEWYKSDTYWISTMGGGAAGTVSVGDCSAGFGRAEWCFYQTLLVRWWMRCGLANCSPSTEMQWRPSDVRVMDLVGASGQVVLEYAQAHLQLAGRQLSPTGCNEQHRSIEWYPE